MNRPAVILIVFAAAIFACAAPPEERTRLKKRAIPTTMRLVTVATQTTVYAEPTLAARELARLPAGRRLVFLAKGGEDRIIGAVYSSWFKVRGSGGARGWVFAGHLANVDASRPPFSYKKLIGVWKFRGDAGRTAVYDSRVELKKDARFDFGGWRKKDFQSHGAWIYNNLEDTLSLRFFDKRDFWNDAISSADGRLYRASAGYGKERPTVHMRVERSGDVSRGARFNLLGSFFQRD